MLDALHINDSAVMKWRLRVAVGVILACMAFAYVVTDAVNEQAKMPAWAAPSNITIRRVTTVTGAQTASNLFSNIDCTVLTYRLVASSAMQSGCFTETAFGMLDNDSDVAIFNDTDEGVQLITYTAHQVLVTWPKALNLVALTPVNTGGTYIGLYKNPLAVLRDERNLAGQLINKELSSPPELSLKAPDGSPLVINPETLAFSDNGSWLVAETLNGSFVRINLASLSVVAFAPAYGSQGSPALLKSRVAITDDGQFIAIANDDAQAVKVYALGTCDGIMNNLAPQHCQSYNYWPYLGQQTGGNRSVRHVHFIAEGLLSAEVTTINAANDGIYEFAPAASISALTAYIGLGDSYTSGEGAFDYLDGSDTPDDMCHVSRYSYPMLLSQDLFSAAGGHSVACSGAVINDVGSESLHYKGQVRGVASLEQMEDSQPLLLETVEANFISGYVSQQRFVKRWQPLIATVSVGGDDIGFGDMVTNCVEPHISSHSSDNTCYGTYEDRLEITRLIDRTIPRWTSLYNQLKREAPAMHLYVVGYPQIASSSGSCALNVHLNKDELQFAGNVIAYLNQAIQKASVAAGATYVDISQALNGHRLCETASYSVAVNGLTAGTDAGPLGSKLFGKESYHPNALGQSLMEQAILQQTHNFEDANAGNSESTDSTSTLLDAPRTGRQVYVKIPDKSMTPGIGKRGAPLLIQANGITDGLRSNAPYAVHLDGPGGSVLGILTSDDAGNISGNFTLPESTQPGGHTIDVVGSNQGGESSDVTQPIYVPATDADSDGDGVEDIFDSCPGAINSGQDNDQDGVDDACDGVIGTARSSTPPSGRKGLTVSGITERAQIGSINRQTSHKTTPVDRVTNLARGTSPVRYPTPNMPLKTLHWLPWLLVEVLLWVAFLFVREIPKK